MIETASRLELPTGYTGELMAYSDEAARQIGTLMNVLTPRHNGSPIAERVLRHLIDSPDHTQLVAVRGPEEEPQIVGAASMSTMVETCMGRVAWLGSFVVHPDYRAAQHTGADMPVADSLWDEMQRWSDEHDLDQLAFTTSEERRAAVTFYTRHGVALAPRLYGLVTVGTDETI